MAEGDTYRNKEQGSFGILNFRDLAISSAENAETKRYMKEGLVFRSATLDHMNQGEVDAFIEKYKINTILDLRTSMEGRESLPIDMSFPTSATSITQSFVFSSPDKKDDMSVISEEYNTTGQDTLIKKKYRVDFAGKTFKRYCVFGSCSLLLKIYIIYLMIFCQRQKATYVICKQVLSPMGVNKMYQQFATYCKGELLEALLVFANPNNYPIEIHCTQGKDRTGIVAAMIMSIAGVPDEVIINDYAKTQKGLAPIYDEMLQEIRKAGLSEEFAQAPPSNMRDLLAFLRESHGSIEGYLDSIGFGHDLRERVRSTISV